MCFYLNHDVLRLLKAMFCINPGVLGAFVAACALLFTYHQLKYKELGKKAEKNTNLFSKYLYIIHQAVLSVSSIEGFKKLYIRSSTSQQELFGYARSHINDNVFHVITDFIELAVPCFNGKDKKMKVRKALDFCSSAERLVYSINSFYQSILQNQSMTYTINQIDEVYEIFSSNLCELKDIHTQNTMDPYGNQLFDTEESFWKIMKDLVCNIKINRSFTLRWLLCCLVAYILFCMFFLTVYCDKIIKVQRLEFEKCERYFTK